MDLTSGPFLALLIVLATLPIVGLVRTRGWRRICSAVLALGGVLLVLAALVNQHFSYVRHVEDLFGLGSREIVDVREGAPPGEVARTLGAVAGRSPGRGVLLKMPVPGQRSGIKGRSAYVYLPAQYFAPEYAGTRFPVLELLHGMPGEPADFLRSLDADRLYEKSLEQRRTGPMIVVMPDGNGSRWRSTEGVNAVGGERAETYLTEDVADTVERYFRALPRGRDWALAGFSVGGYAAVNLALRHPDQYGAAASMSGYYTAVEDEYTGKLYRGDERVKRENSPTWWIEHHPLGRQAFYLMAGSDDSFTWEHTPPFHRRLRELGADVELAVMPNGKHDYRAWRKSLPDVYNWAWAKVDAAELKGAFPARRQPALPDRLPPASRPAEGETGRTASGKPLLPRAEDVRGLPLWQPWPQARSRPAGSRPRGATPLATGPAPTASGPTSWGPTASGPTASGPGKGSHLPKYAPRTDAPTDAAAHPAPGSADGTAPPPTPDITFSSRPANRR
ncbi:alpha/beta hydrolase-fold protein [Streptomyces sp. URMC 123]|uniref:alpha/beta hydrolase n=1 Tax=Streptomyces sp. URMC 123 TaxID=3423403 RepID=UPI003F1C7F90